MAIFVLDQVQMLNQQIAVPWFVPQKGPDILPSGIGELTAFRMPAPFAFTGFPDTFAWLFATGLLAIIQRHCAPHLSITAPF